MCCLCVGQAAFDFLDARGIDDGGLAEASFLFRRFVRQDVAVIGVMAHDFAGACHFEALGSTSFGFHFRHDKSPFCLPNRRNTKTSKRDIWRFRHRPKQI